MRRREGMGLRPIVTNGVPYYREEEVRSLTTRRTVCIERPETTVPEVDEDAQAADVFALLEQGVTPVGIVQRLRMLPNAVEALHTQWARMNGGFVVTAATKAELEKLTGPKGRPVRGSPACAIGLCSFLGWWGVAGRFRALRGQSPSRPSNAST